MDEIELN